MKAVGYLKAVTAGLALEGLAWGLFLLAVWTCIRWPVLSVFALTGLVAWGILHATHNSCHRLSHSAYVAAMVVAALVGFTPTALALALLLS